MLSALPLTRALPSNYRTTRLTSEYDKIPYVLSVYWLMFTFFRFEHANRHNRTLETSLGGVVSDYTVLKMSLQHSGVVFTRNLLSVGRMGLLIVISRTLLLIVTCSALILFQYLCSKIDLPSIISYEIETVLFYLKTQYFDKMANSNQRKLIVGIDFGTTYTGAAWAETRRVCGQTSTPTLI